MADVRAFQRTTRQSPYKMRLVIDQIRGKYVNEALALLAFSKKHAAKQIEKTLKSAVANAEFKAREANESLDPDRLYVKLAIINEGPKLKRFMPAAHGTRNANPQADEPRRDRGCREGRTLMGQKTNPIGFRLGDHARASLEVVRQPRLPGAAQGRRAAAQVSARAPRARGDLRSHDRAQAGEGRRHRAHRASGRRDREEGRRGRQAAR